MNTFLKVLVLGTALALGTNSIDVSAHPRPQGAPFGGMNGPMAKARMARGPVAQLIKEVRLLETIYRRQGNEAAIVAMYQDLRARAGDHPILKRFAEHRLEMAERMANPQKEIETLKKRIDEHLAKLN